MQRFQFAQTNGIYTFEIGNHSDVNLPYHQLMVETSLDQPLARIKVEVRASEDTDWILVSEAQSLPVVGNTASQFCAVAKYYRFTLTGIVGGSGQSVVLRIYDSTSWFGAMPPVGLYEGIRAMTVQSYTEANVKNGLQYECSYYLPSLAAGATASLTFSTGAKPVIVKNRQVAFTGSKVTGRVYSGTTYTGGTVVTPYNLTAISPIASTVVLRLDPTILTPGTEGGAPSHYIGSDLNGNQQAGTFVSPDVERILAPFTVYRLAITNDDIEATKLSVYLTWYEGTPDLPRVF